MKRTVLVVLLFVVFNNIYSRDTTFKQPYEVKLFEFVYEKSSAPHRDYRRIIMLQNDSAQALFRKAIIKALNEKWNFGIADLPLSLKQLGTFALIPKFKTKIENAAPGKWYIFFQAFETSFSSVFDERERTAVWKVKLKIVSGNNDSVITDRKFDIEFYRQPAPGGQLIVMRLPAYPNEYYKMFDSVAAWTVAANDNTEYMMSLQQAILFDPSSTVQDAPLKEMQFKNSMSEISHSGDPSFTLSRRNVTRVKTKTKRKVGNTVGGAFTLITGIGTEKRKYNFYTADYHFSEGERQYHCVVDYTEVESAERQRTKDEDGSVSTDRGEYTVTERYVDSADKQLFILGTDTIGWFTARYFRENIAFTQMWNGYDSSTVTAIPFEWKNTVIESDVLLNGELNGTSFTMKTSNGTRKKLFSLNGVPAFLVIGHGKAESGSLFQPVNEEVIRLMIILSSIPYESMN